jgi:HAD superfamily hydrolase (TIGR01450 family)
MTDRRGVPGPPHRLFDAYAIDLDGTVYVDDTALPGAVEAVTALRDEGRPVVFVTNNPLHTASDYAAKLTRFGLPTEPSDVVTATDSVVGLLERSHPGAALMTVSESQVEHALESAGFRLTRDPAATDVVVVSFDRSFDYAKLDAAYRAVRLHGAVIVATNPDPYCPTADGGLPDCAAMLAAIEACTGRRAEAVAGKPSLLMAEAVLERLGTAAAATAMVGDRLATDIAMAAAAEMTGVLVLGSTTSDADLAAASPRPAHAVETLLQLLPTVG